MAVALFAVNGWGNAILTKRRTEIYYQMTRQGQETEYRTRDDTNENERKKKRKPELLIGRDTSPSQLLLEVVVALSERLIGVGLSRQPDPTDLEVLSKG